MLQVEQVSVIFHRNRQKPVQALQDVSFNLAPGESLGIVGESGCGKSTLVRSILQLTSLQDGQIFWHGQSLAQMSRQQQQDFRRQAQLIFQDPLEALNPRMTVAEIISEPLRNLTSLNPQEITRRVKGLLLDMGLNEDQLHRYPHEFSGGQCQRIGIARAMSITPELLVCDEPVSALDVSVQAQIINLLQNLRREKNLALIFISHDLSIVQHVSDRVLVLYQGRIMETATTEILYQNPQHPYTRCLLEAIPRLDTRTQSTSATTCQTPMLERLEHPGQSSGCPFYARCDQAISHCKTALPALTTLEPGHLVACHRVNHQPAVF